MKLNIIVLCIFTVCLAALKKRIIPKLERKSLITANLPANWTNIRDEVSDTFTCEGKQYGYYADVDNDCQIFHVCLPIDGRRNLTYRWSFICPEETIFNQATFTCNRLEDSINCDEAPDFYHLNDNFGQIDEDNDSDDDNEKKEEEEEKPNSIDAQFTNTKRKTKLG